MGLTRPLDISDHTVFRSVFEIMRELTATPRGIVVVLPVYGAIEIV